MRRIALAIAGLALTPFTVRAVAAEPTLSTPDQIAAAFGQREFIQQISLSPDGTKVAMIVAKGRGAALLIADLVSGNPKTILSSNGQNERLNDCHWSTISRIVCRILMTTDVGGPLMNYSRIVAIDAAGGSLKLLSARSNGDALWVAQSSGDMIDWGANGTGSALMTRTYVPEYSTGTRMGDTREGLGVDLVDTNTLARKMVEPPRYGAVEYISDGQGVVRIMGVRSFTSSGYNNNRIDYFYRMPNSSEWRTLTTLTLSAGLETGFNPYAIDRAKNVVYGFENLNGRTGLYSVSLDGRFTKTAVLERSDVDISSLVKIGRQNRVVGATYVTDRRESEFFDPGLKALRVSLAKALPGKLITFVDSSLDENLLLLFAGSDIDPGRYYVFDKKTRQLAEVMPTRPSLAGVRLAAVKSITYRAADGTSIPAYLTLPVGSDGKNLPGIVMPHGGPGARDEWGFDWLAQFFAARGYAVIQPNFRGSTGYGDVWYQKNGFQSWRTAIGDVNDAGRWLVSRGITDRSKLAIVGWSYGGYAALQTSVLDSDLFRAIVAIAPVTDLETLRNESRDFTNFPQVDAFIGHGPWVTDGSPARNTAKIKVPVLLFHGDRDRNVGIGESRLMANRLKASGGQVELVEFKGLDHQLDDTAARTQLLSKADAFLRAAMRITP